MVDVEPEMVDVEEEGEDLSDDPPAAGELVENGYEVVLYGHSHGPFIEGVVFGSSQSLLVSETVRVLIIRDDDVVIVRIYDG